VAWRLLLEVDVDGADEVGEDALLAALAPGRSPALARLTVADARRRRHSAAVTVRSTEVLARPGRSGRR